MNKLVAAVAFAALLALPGFAASDGVEHQPQRTTSTPINQPLDALLSSGWEITGLAISDGIIYTLRNGSKWALCAITQHHGSDGMITESRCWALN